MQSALLAVTLLAVPLYVSATISSNTSDITINAKDQPLAQVVSRLERESGVSIELASELRQDNINITLSKRNTREAISALLANYSHVDILDGHGQWKRVLVTGRRGNGANLAATDSGGSDSSVAAVTTLVETVTLGPTVTHDIPEQYQALQPGSLYQVELDATALKAAKKGESVSMFFPDGQHQVVHDNRFEHDNGDVTWVGYMKESGKNYRFIATLGKDATLGRALTTNGEYQIEQVQGHTYLVDVYQSGMQEVHDEHHALDNFEIPQVSMIDAFLRGNWAQQLMATLNPIRVAEAATNSTITLWALYTTGVNKITSCASPDAAVTRINNLVAITNQAYVDSSVNITMQLVGTTCVSSYSISNANNTALNVLKSSGQGTVVAGFPTASGTPTVQTTRNSNKADLVTFIRPFGSGHGSCGVAYVNNSTFGSRWAANFTNWAWSVVSDGSYKSGSTTYYCTDYTLAHETGHNMGCAHGNTSSNGSGVFPYSYGYGKDKVFGTIMNYYSPRVGKFSNPNKTCPGPNPCGIANTNDNARSLNNVAAAVSTYK